MVCKEGGILLAWISRIQIGFRLATFPIVSSSVYVMPGEPEETCQVRGFFALNRGRG
jgi:hypothetical protein